MFIPLFAQGIVERISTIELNEASVGFMPVLMREAYRQRRAPAILRRVVIRTKPFFSFLPKKFIVRHCQKHTLDTLYAFNHGNMGFDALGKLTKAQEYVAKKWEQGKARKDGRQAHEAARQKNAFLALVSQKVAGTSAVEMPPLTFHPDTSHRAVFLVTIPISFGPFELSKQSYKLLARHVGMTLNSVSHWALCVIDRGFDACWCYDLMSDQMALNMIGKNVFRVNEVTAEATETWSSCYYVGETSQSHEEIMALGNRHMAAHPRYNLLSSNCQDLVEDLVKELCNGKVITQAKLSEELHKASPRIARDLMVAKLKSNLESKEQKHQPQEPIDDDIHMIKGLERTMTERGS
ncbi:hypothetical protein F5Y15DRAFT_112764 [Xylariaceae sp. FL0016]|nr:hypothetical protein F5Y15DRAFT_112764 [Xylariaceae sp. FL0016]